MRTKVLAIFLTLLLLSPSLAFAAGKISPLKKGDPAPFDGILLDPVAEATISAKKESLVKICNADKAAESAKIRAACNLDSSKLKIALETREEIYKERIKLKEKENEFLAKQLKKIDRGGYSHWWYTGGVITGVGVTLAIFKIAVEIKN